MSWEKNEKIPSKICSRIWRNQRDKFNFFIRMRWVSIRWTPLLSIQSTCVISRRVAFSLFASLFACNFHEIKLTFFSFCLKKWKILGMIETKIQSKRKKMKVSIVFISNSDCFLLHSCFYTVLEYLQRLYIFIFKFVSIC